MVRIKICGITNLEDALKAAELGADAVGFVFAESKRRIQPDTAKSITALLPPFVTPVGVFLDAPLGEVLDTAAAAGLRAVQLHGGETPKYCERVLRAFPVIKRITVRPGDTTEAIASRMQDYRVSAFLLDPGAGDGVPFDWIAARGLPHPVVVAGGLTPENVREAVRVLDPMAVDVASGVEHEPGRKDYQKMRKFIQEVR
jgi:phosphoribosylanthranilate isomerase